MPVSWENTKNLKPTGLQMQGGKNYLSELKSVSAFSAMNMYFAHTRPGEQIYESILRMADC